MLQNTSFLKQEKLDRGLPWNRKQCRVYVENEIKALLEEDAVSSVAFVLN